MSFASLPSPAILIVVVAIARSHAAIPPKDPVRLESETLSVLVDPEFPRTVKYLHKPSGETVDGQATPVSAIELNGKPADCKVSFRKQAAGSADYHLNFTESRVSLMLHVEVGANTVTWTVSNPKETGTVKIHTLAFPGNAMLTVDTRQADAALAFTHCTNTHDNYKTTFREYVGPLKDAVPGTDSGNYLFLSGGKLASAITSTNDEDVARTTRLISEKDGIKSCAARTPVWQLRSFDDEPPALPVVSVIVTSDINSDGKADWQDAALVYRRTMPMPFGHERVKSTVGENIAMNFASGAQQPFLKILDEIKKCSLATDNIGQQVTIKGFSSEGHDSANTDYSGHYNERAGGLKDFNTLLDNAAHYNARVGIHINASEAYPEALRYRPEILQRNEKGELKEGWVWLDHGHMIDKVKDTRSGQLFASLEQMKKDLPNLGYVYLDTYWENGWPAAQIARKFAALKLPFATEGDSALDPWSIWAHWRGNFDSQVMRFLWFSDRDISANDPILRGGRADSDTFMGWQGQHSFNNFITGTFSRHLPAKYLQHFELQAWTPGKEARFSDGVKVTAEGEAITVTRNNRVVMTWTGAGANSRLFVPWDPEGEGKIYVWDEVGTAQTWELPPTWKDRQEVFLYQLTDLGRTEETRLPVTDGRVTLTAIKNTPYVIYPAQAPAQALPAFGEGSFVRNPGFDSGKLDEWNPSPTAAANVAKDGVGNRYLTLTGEAASEVSQTLIDLQPGRSYAASAWVQVKGKRTASIEVECGGKKATNFVDRTNVVHSAPNDARSGTYYQRVQVVFDVPAGHSSARLQLKAAMGQPGTTVEFDDVRVALSARSPEAAKHFFWEDFEQVTFGGYGPFTCCPGERTHLSETNKPHTSDTISGKFSLKSRDGGRVGRTLPSTIRFKPNTLYRLKCLTMGAGHLTAESKGKTVLNLQFPNLPANGIGKIEGTFPTGNDPGSFLSLFRDGGTDFIAIDDLAIDEIGPAPAIAKAAPILYNDKLPGRRILMEEGFSKPLSKDWNVITSKHPGTSIVSADGALVISAADNVCTVAERVLPAGTTAVECRLSIEGDQGQTWGPGLFLVWPGGQQLRINVRIPDARFNVESTVAGEVKGPKWQPADSVALRLRIDPGQVIAEARNDAGPWQTVATFPRDKFPGEPNKVRLGKMHVFEADDHGEPGNDGGCSFRKFRIYGK
ncbi:endo-alpha-N-acetylgalactosaminidase family protein [Luteolibacter arcticus]|uniref:Endo-alpha-N-acetylgalactosaminidase family protein n=1 Tax=Luteolibacter arcticus TaxID=1581411 RepID=A0ABT3GLP1_9BACT|nr:endo-alpha-N-acetylgalactosaminidase family protein [Luteolibacter arcticus]MCW1924449.1 endo-alpha-N-acetylgalactosaminidase family protein [Luteolibacter arcticus]